MAFNVYRFSNGLKPNLSNRFEVIFLTPKGEVIDDIKYSFNVKSVTLPTWSLDTSNTRKRFGSTQYVIPILAFAKTSLKITFIETEGLTVTNNLLSLFNSTNYWELSDSAELIIRIVELDYTSIHNISSKIYKVKLTSISQPSFSNTAKGEPIEITAEFNVLYELNSETEAASINISNRGTIRDQSFEATIDAMKEAANANNAQFEENLKNYKPILPQLLQPKKKGTGKTGGIKKRGEGKAKVTKPLGIKQGQFKGKSRDEFKKLLIQHAFDEIKKGVSGGIGEGTADDIYALGNDSNFLKALNLGYGTNLTRQQAVKFGVEKLWDKANEKILAKISKETNYTIAQLKDMQEGKNDEGWKKLKKLYDGTNGDVRKISVTASEVGFSASDADKILMEKVTSEVTATLKLLNNDDITNIEEVFEHMDDKGIHGISHLLGYAGTGAGKNIGKYLSNNKDGIIAELDKNSGFLSEEYVNARDNDRSLIYHAGPNEHNRLQRATANGLQPSETWKVKQK